MRWALVRRAVLKHLRKPRDLAQATVLGNGVVAYYFPHDPINVPAHGTKAFDTGYSKDENPFPTWRFIARRKWDAQWDEAYESYRETRS